MPYAEIAADRPDATAGGLVPKVDDQFGAVAALRTGMKIRTLAAVVRCVTAVRSEQVQAKHGLGRGVPGEHLMDRHIVHLNLASTPRSPIQWRSMPGYGREVLAVSANT
jgi:hypothetical protein